MASSVLFSDKVKNEPQSTDELYLYALERRAPVNTPIEDFVLAIVEKLTLPSFPKFSLEQADNLRINPRRLAYIYAIVVIHCLWLRKNKSGNIARKGELHRFKSTI